jgi:4-amino-4-deoxy-L-arabinose transferase-like glycosyltransferase
MSAAVTTSLPSVADPPGAPRDPRWVRPALVALLVGTAVLYLWDLGSSGWANTYYSAAVQAMASDWKAFLFGSSDAGNSIMVDKPPAALWVMALSARIFGVNAWSILVPQALMGVASVGVLYATVRRWHGPAAGLIAGGVLALTPVAVLMFRFNNPDAALVLLLVLGAWAMTRALERARTGWLLAAAAFVGFAFLAKSLQAFLVVPAFALVYLMAAPTGLGRRIWQLLLAGLTMLVTAGWWVAMVELWPAADRPYVGGSQTNSVLELIFGYNGFGRLTGNEVGRVGGPGRAGAGQTVPLGPPGGAGMVGPAPGGGGGFGGGPPGGGFGGGGFGNGGATQLFDASSGGQISWLLPAALILLVALLVLGWRTRRTGRLWASALLWGGWLLVTGLVFMLMRGIYHPYYTVALAPAIAALVGIGTVVLWRRRARWWARGVLAGAVAVTATWAFVLLAGTPDWLPWLRWVILAVGAAAVVGVLAGGRARHAGRWGRRTAVVLAVAIGLAALAGPAAYAVQTAATPHSGAIPSAGPAGAFGRGGPGDGQRIIRGDDGRAQLRPPADGGAQPGQAAPPGTGQPGAGRFGGGPGGGLLTGSTPNAELVALLSADADRYTWVAAAVGANTAGGYQLATGEPVMPVGGFNGSDPSPTLQQFQDHVAQGRIHYFVGGGGFGPSNGGSSAGAEIAQWVEQNFTPRTVGGVTVYDLTQ